MTNFLTLIPLVATAITLSTAKPVTLPNPPFTPYSVSWNQTRTSPSQTSGGLGSSVQGHFPAMSSDQIGLGCGVNWENGQLHAGFDGGDKNNGVGGGFNWTPHSLAGIVGLRYGEQKINLNLTITDDNEVLFSVNGNQLDWEKVLKAQKGQDGEEWEPRGKDSGPVLWYDGKAYALDKPIYRTKMGEGVIVENKPKGKDAGPVQYDQDGHTYALDNPIYHQPEDPKLGQSGQKDNNAAGKDKVGDDPVYRLHNGSD